MRKKKLEHAAFVFDGTSDIVKFYKNGKRDFKLPKNFTIECWIEKGKIK
jgi:hypothetical protein